jgi:hypothetical protein
MTHTEVLLAVAILAGFVVLLLTLGAFIARRATIGILALVLAGVCFVAALVLMGKVSADQDAETRAAVTAKYDVKIQAWGNPLGTDPEWIVDGRKVDCEAILTDRSDPIVKCGDEKLVELPLRAK